MSFGEMSDAPAPIICTAKCSASALKDIFGEYDNIHYFLSSCFSHSWNKIYIRKIFCLSKLGNIHEEVEMDVGTDSLQREYLKEFTNSQEEEPTKTEPIAITRGRRRPSGKSCTDHEKV